MARRRIGASQATPASELDIVLKPLSRPELGEIRVDGVLAVGRAEQPFASYKDDFVVMLSRRHARIFCEDGVVYVADLGSSNGTTVNRAAVGQIAEPAARRRRGLLRRRAVVPGGDHAAREGAARTRSP